MKGTLLRFPAAPVPCLNKGCAEWILLRHVLTGWVA